MLGSGVDTVKSPREKWKRLLSERQLAWTRLGEHGGATTKLKEVFKKKGESLFEEKELWIGSDRTHEFELSRLSLFVYEALAGSTFALRQEAGASISCCSH